MKCPACQNELSSMVVGPVTVDACQGGCGGIWFDNFELSKVDEAEEAAGEKLLHLEIRGARPGGESRRCPKCKDVTMMRHFRSVKRKVLVDECAKCGGIWLDAGELGAIRDEFKTDAERRKAAERYFDEVFGKHLATLRARDRKGAEQARAIAHIFRYVCPSYYLPGKQPWGAF
ncbi:MAG TPA: zf-TFIIB domain-containing protein [Methylomirabilota bacterium]